MMKKSIKYDNKEFKLKSNLSPAFLTMLFLLEEHGKKYYDFLVANGVHFADDHEIGLYIKEKFI